MSRYNPSICYQQPPRRSQLLWLASRPGESHPVPQSLPYQLDRMADDEASTGCLASGGLQFEPRKVGEREARMTKSKCPNPHRRSGVIADPNALINRPKSAYTRNLRTMDEEPVFWQHSHRATSRFRQSQFSIQRPVSPPITRHYSDLRRSNASDFKILLEETFARQPVLKLQPNPIINIEPPATPSLAPTPIECAQSTLDTSPYLPPTPNQHPQTSQEAKQYSPPSPTEYSQSLQEKNLPSLPSSNSSSPQDSPGRKRFSGFRPLQLSFYLPGNRLSLLPRFSDDDNVYHDIPPVPGITRPPSALLKAKPSAVFNAPLTSNSIPRKAVASRVTSTMDESNRSSFQSSVTLTGGTYSRGSLVHDRRRSDKRLSKNTWSNPQGFQKDVEAHLPSLSRPASHTWTEVSDRFSRHRTSAQSLQLETDPEEPQQTEFECPTISEECSPVSPVSPVSPAYSKKHSAVDYHDYEFTGEVSQLPERHSAVEYHDYEFVGEVRRVPAITESPFQGDSLHVAPLFHSSSGSADSSDDELPLPSKPRSSSGSSTLYHGESSSESDLPARKTTISVAFPSPTLQHRLSEWLSRSASQVQAFSPQQGECYGHIDSPTLGFSWKDFGFNTEKRASKVEDANQHARRRAFTDGSSVSTYVDGALDMDPEKFPVPVSMAHTIGVGVAF